MKIKEKYAVQIQKLKDGKVDMKIFTPREKKTLEMRFGLIDGIEHTLEEVGQDFDVTRERIRGIEIQALNKIV